MNTKNLITFYLSLFIMLCISQSALAAIPHIVSFSPADNSTGVTYNTNFVATFDIPVCSGAASGLRIYHSSDDSTYANIDGFSSDGSSSGWGTTTVTFDPSMALESYTNYYMHLDSLIYDCSDWTMMDTYAGIYDKTTWNITSGATPCGTVFTEPCKDPVDDASNVSPWTNIAITFNENINVMDTGISINLKLSSDNSLVEAFYMNGTDGRTTIASKSITLNPASNLLINTSYYVEISGTSIYKQSDGVTAYQGDNSTTWNFSTGNQWWCVVLCGNNSNITDPVFTPLDNATGVALTSNLTMLFNATLLHIGTAAQTIKIKKASDDSIVESIAMNSPKITISNANYMGDVSLDTKIIVNPAATLDGSTSYYVDIGCDALRNVSNESFGLDSSATVSGVSGKTIWNFTTEAGGDSTPPTVSSFTPADNATGISILTNLSILFTEAVDLQTGNLVIKRSSSNATIETISVGSGQVTGNGTTTIAFNPSVTLLNGTAYYVQIDATAIDDLAGNSYAGISDTTTWNFTTSGTADTTAPTILYYSPANTAAMVERYQGLNLTFSEPIIKGSGTIYVKRYSDDATIYSIDVSSSDVVISGASFTIKGPSLLNAGSRFYVELPSGVVTDSYSNDFTGISNKNTWNFNTTQDHSLYNSY